MVYDEVIIHMLSPSVLKKIAANLNDIHQEKEGGLETHINKELTVTNMK
jgi:hypothetical protein